MYLPETYIEWKKMWSKERKKNLKNQRHKRFMYIVRYSVVQIASSNFREALKRFFRNRSTNFARLCGKKNFTKKAYMNKLIIIELLDKIYTRRLSIMYPLKKKQKRWKKFLHFCNDSVLFRAIPNFCTALKLIYAYECKTAKRTEMNREKKIIT